MPSWLIIVSPPPASVSLNAAIWSAVELSTATIALPAGLKPSPFARDDADAGSAVFKIVPSWLIIVSPPPASVSLNAAIWSAVELSVATTTLDTDVKI